MPDNRSRRAWVREIPCKTWEEAKKAFASVSPGMFRGQQRASWDLLTSLDRLRCAKSRHAEHELWKHFRRRALQHIPPALIPSDLHGWLSLMQHYGVPTRFLDFTESEYVAAYFALEVSNVDPKKPDARPEDHAVWAINWARVVHAFGPALAKVWPSRIDPIDVTLMALREQQAQIVDFLWAKGLDVKGAFPTTPWILEPRQAAQQSVFLASANVELDLMTNLDALANTLEPESREFALKILIPESERIRALRELQRMNVHAGVLFPDLGGLARQVKLLVECA